MMQAKVVGGSILAVSDVAIGAAVIAGKAVVAGSMAATLGFGIGAIALGSLVLFAIAYHLYTNRQERVVSQALPMQASEVNIAWLPSSDEYENKAIAALAKNLFNGRLESLSLTMMRPIKHEQEGKLAYYFKQNHPQARFGYKVALQQDGRWEIAMMKHSQMPSSIFSDHLESSASIVPDMDQPAVEVEPISEVALAVAEEHFQLAAARSLASVEKFWHLTCFLIKQGPHVERHGVMTYYVPTRLLKVERSLEGNWTTSSVEKSEIPTESYRDGSAIRAAFGEKVI